MIRFVKAHACGNDFLIVDEPLNPSRFGTVTQTICARNTGIGADGVEFLSLADNGSYTVRLFNADGSEAEISGNGTRCVAAYLAQEDPETDEFSIRTHAGLRRCRILKRNAPEYLISTAMGVPVVTPKVVTLGDGTPIAGVSVSIGNPHFVIFVDSHDFSCFRRPWQQIGADLCTHPEFPNGTNVEFVRMIDPDRIEFRIFERGVGPTLSSGTGTSASAAAAMETKGLERKLRVTSEGGEQTVEWIEKNADLLLTGPATIIAQGDCFLL